MHVATLALFAFLPQFPQHAIAVVNDPRSHGAVGDAKLSLNEVIQLCNHTLAPERLSAAERAQIQGDGEPSTVHVDAIAVPVLRMERQLDEVVDSIHGFYLEGLNGVPTIDFTGTRGLRTRASSQSFRRLRLQGGDVAVDSIADAAYHTCWLEEVECVGQGVAGVRLVSRGAGAYWRLIVVGCTFEDSTLELVDEAPGGTGLLEIEGVNVFGAGGIELTLGAPGAVDVAFERIACERGGVAVRRSGSGRERTLRLQATHVLGTHFVVAGAAQGSSSVQVADLALAGDGAGLRLGARDAQLDALIQDFRLQDGAVIDGGAGPGAHLENGTCDTGPIELRGPVVLERCRFTEVDVRGADGRVEIRDSDLHGGSLMATGGTVLLANCHLAGSVRDPRVQVVAPRDEPWHAALDVLPALPRLGGLLEFQSVVPPGRVGLWCFGPTVDTAVEGPLRTRFYLDVNAMVVLPSVLQGRGALSVPIPLDPALRKTDTFVQLLVLPDGTSRGPAVLAPPGRRLVFR